MKYEPDITLGGVLLAKLQPASSTLKSTLVLYFTSAWGRRFSTDCNEILQTYRTRVRN